MTTLRLLSSDTQIDVCKYMLGLGCAIAICVAAYLLLMVAYFTVRRKRPSAKYGIELIFVVIAMALSVGVKLAILPYLADGTNGNLQDFTFVEYMGYSLSAIYSMIGGLQFEGLQFGMDVIGGGIAVCLYYGSSILAGLIVLSVITAKASYEIFSLVIIKVLKKRRDVYVFNCLTPDALLLAENIAEHHLKELSEYKANKNKNPNLKKPRKALILFAGNNIPAFSRNDPNCREIMSQSFYYYSLMKGNDTKRSLFSRLKLRRKNISLLTTQPHNMLKQEAVDCKIKTEYGNLKTDQNEITKKEQLGNKGNKTRIMEFYFALDENKKPLQEKNTFDAFSEFDMIIDDLFYKKKHNIKLKSKYIRWLKKSEDKLSKSEVEEKIYTLLYFIGLNLSWTITEQYILTQSDVNYEYFSGQIKERVSKIVEYLLNRPITTYFSSTTANKLFASLNKKEKKEKNDKQKKPLRKLTLKEYFAARKKYSENRKQLCLNDLINENKRKYDSLFKKGFDGEFRAIIEKYVCSILQVNLVNEAYLSSLSLIDERYKKLGASSIWAHLATVDDSVGNNDYKALILGFGGNGQNALHALYYASSHIDDNGSITGFYADVFDNNIEEIEGIFAKNHPLYHCYPSSNPKVDQKAEDNDKELPKDKVDVNEQEIRNIYKEFLKDKVDVNEQDVKTKDTYSYDNLCSQMQFPKIVFHKDSCRGVSFIRFFDEKTGEEFTETGKGDKKNKEYNMVVIALGNDSANIAIANTIIDDIKRELYLEINNDIKTYNKRRQCIAVNIRDKNNLRKLNWDETDFKYGLFKNVVVFPFGSKEEIYTFDKIIDHSAMYEYNTNYINMTQKIDELEIEESNDTSLVKRFALAMTALSKKYCIEKDENDKLRLDKLFSKIYEERNKADKREIDSIRYNLSYFNLNNFKKETNRISNVYSRIMRRAVKRFSKNEKGEFALELDNIRKLVMLEHDRWNRFMISHGWIYSKVKGDEHKMHNSLLPLGYISEYSFAYDLINVIAEVYKIYNHSYILYKNLIKHCNTVDELYDEISYYLSYCYKANGLKSTKHSIELVNSGEYPTIKICFEPTANNNGTPKKDAVLFSMHYDIHSRYDKYGNVQDLSDNSVYVDDYSTPYRVFSAHGGADDLAGVACVLYGIMSALKEQEEKNNQKKIIVLISGGEELGAQGIRKYLTDERIENLKEKVKECVVVDINDKIGVYSTKGTRFERVKVSASLDVKKKLKKMGIIVEKTDNQDFIIELKGKKEKEIEQTKKEITEALKEKKLKIKIINSTLSFSSDTLCERKTLTAHIDAEKIFKSKGATVEYPENQIFNIRVYGKDEAEITKKIQNICEALKQDNLSVNISAERERLAVGFDTIDSEFISRIEAAIEKAGVKSKSVTLEKSFSDANVIVEKLDVPTILLSSGAINAHKEGEYIYLDDLDKNVEIIKNYVLN